MKKNITIWSCFFAAIFLLQQSATAQVTGCSTSRYLVNSFTNTTKTTVQYGSNLNTVGFPQDLYMDIYQPTFDTAAKRPAIIFAHGGSFLFGSRADMNQLCLDFALKGYVTATIDYRLWSFAGGIPDSFDMLGVVAKAIGDMKASVRYLRLDAATTNTFKIDTNNIFVAGLSAGAIAALHVGMMGPNDPLPSYLPPIIAANGGWEGSSGDAVNLSHSSKVKGVMSLSGALYRKEIMDANDAPFIAVQGTDDATVPFNKGIAAGIITMEGSNLLDQRATAVGVSHYFKAVPGGGHTDIYTQPQFANDMATFYINGLLFLKNLMCSPTATDENQPLAEQIEVYPNPAHDAMTIGLETQHPCDIWVFDIMGRAVKNFSQVSNNVVLRAAEIGRGTFILHVVASDGKTTTSQKIKFD